MDIEIRELRAEEGREHVPALAQVLRDCVEGGASVSFMAGFTKAAAEAFFENVVDGVAVGVIPDYALFPDGSPCDTTIFWKKVGERKEARRGR